MGNFFPDEIIEEVRLANDIVSIISEYVVLKKKGRNYTGLCPFHQEKTPSFMVSPDKQIFHCFGCGVGGNVLSFIMKLENSTFPEAMRMLADKAGISLPEKEEPYKDKKILIRDKAHEINKLATDYYHHILTNEESGQAALDYLLQRGTSREVIDRFKLGYAPSSWDGLLNYLGQNGYAAEEISRFGLAMAKERNNGYYDRFRNRVMYPIMEIGGKVVGFGGRVIDDSLPKYLNSPETEVFNKSRLLFGLNLGTGAIRSADQVIIMEGYMDVISAHQFGIKNTVASLGTALTREQGKLLMRYTHNVVIAYDADQAGVMATIRGLEILQELGCQVKVLSIPEGKDPDEFLKKQGQDAFQNLVKKAQSLIEYKVIKAMEKIDISKVEGKLAVVGELINNLKNIEIAMQREDAICLIADKLHMSPQDIRSEYEKSMQNGRKKLLNRDNLTKNRYNTNMSEIVSENSVDKLPAQRQLTTREKAETGLFRLMLEDNSVFEKVQQKIGLDFFRRPEYIKIISVVQEKYQKNNFYQLGELVDCFGDDEAISQLLTQIMLQEVADDNIQKIADDYINTIKKADDGKTQEKLLKEMAAAEKSGNFELVKQILTEYQKLL